MDIKKLISSIKQGDIDEIKSVLVDFWYPNADDIEKIVRASLGSDFQTFKYIIKKFGPSRLSIEEMSIIVAEIGNLDVFKTLLIGVKMRSELLRELLEKAIEGDNTTIIDFLLRRYQNELKLSVIVDDSFGLVAIDDPKVMSLFLNWGLNPLKPIKSLGYCLLQEILVEGTAEVFDLVISKIPPQSRPDVRTLFAIVAKGTADDEMPFHLMDLYPDHKVDIQAKLIWVLKENRAKAIEEAVKRGAVIDRDCLSLAFKVSNAVTIEELIRVGYCYRSPFAYLFKVQ